VGTEFRPTCATTLTIGPSVFAFMPHPGFGDEPDEVFVLEGGEALLYQMREMATGALAALKVSKSAFRGRHIADAVAALLPYASLPGLALGNRICLTRDDYPELIAAFPDLEYVAGGFYYSRSESGSSMSAASVARNSAPRAPSTTRWSQESVSVIMGRTTGC
jgi:hypothetical protein